MDAQTAKRNEDCRRAVIEYLGSRLSIAQSSETIWRKLRRENPEFSADDIRLALEFLIGEGLAARTADELGSTIYYQATSKGALYIERCYGLK